MPEDLSVEEKRKLFYEAKATGKCRLCGWGDGDGTKVCYYDPELGAMVHENSMEVAMALMTPSQRSLLESYDSGKYAYVSKEKLKEDIERAVLRAHIRIRELEDEIKELEARLRDLMNIKTEEEWVRYRVKIGIVLMIRLEPYIDHIKRWLDAKRRNITAFRKYIEMQMAEPEALLDYMIKGDAVIINNRLTMLDEAEDEGYFVVYPDQLEKPFLGKMVWVQKPHLCGGFGRFIAPYHIGCTKCNEEVRLWEFGIDYDVG